MFWTRRYLQNEYVCMFNQSEVSSATDYRVGTQIILFTMNRGIHQDTDKFWYKYTHAIKKEGRSS